MGYEVVRLLGRGGMGVVELARADDGTEVARKRIPLHGSADEIAAARKRIRREAEVLRSLDHPNIVGLIDVEDDGADVVLVMPYLPGGTLADRLRERDRLPADEVAALLGPLLAGLAAAHRQGVVHRDLKPQNVLFDADGRPAITDFGVATSRDATAGLTLAGTLVGTPAYMAPEQARGEPAGPPADVFALGATLLCALTGGGPWGDGEPAVTLRRAARGKVPAIPRTVPPFLRAPLQEMLARDPARRPTAAALLGGADGTRVRTLLTTVRRRRVPLLLATALAVGVVVMAAGVMAGDGDRGAQRSTDRDRATGATTTACTPRPYQPCGSPPAPFTDGERCTEAHADYDGVATNGCEAAPDTVPAHAFAARTAIAGANLVPEDDIDEYDFEVRDNFQLTCDGTLRVTLTAPKGAVTQVLQVLRGDEVLGETNSANGEPATLTLREPRCIDDDSGMLTARVSTLSGRAAAPYRLERSGSY